MASSSNKIPLASYLFTRLRQLGVGSVHGVPGDTNLPLLDYVEQAGLRWVGSTNELNASYAADGYARIKGLGVLITTFGVGELSAINGVAGSFAERAAVVHIVGTPSRQQQDAHQFVHHSIRSGDFRTFSDIYSNVTIGQAHLWDTETAPEDIDRVLTKCLLHSQPVYISLPVDLVSFPVPNPELILLPQAADPRPDAARDEALESVLRKMRSSKQPMILVDGEIRPMGVTELVNDLVKATGWPTWTTPFGKGLLNESLDHFQGIYRGKHADKTTRSYVEGADVILCFGCHHSFTNTYNFSSIPNADASIYFMDTTLHIGDSKTPNVPAKYGVSYLLQSVRDTPMNRYPPIRTLSRDSYLSLSEAPDDLPITHDRLWRLMARIIRPGDIVLGDTGTSGHGVREMALPEHVRLFTHVTWLCVGYGLPAAQGASLAQQERIAAGEYHGIRNARTILFIGDGGFQMTMQELATIIRHDLDVILVVINNGGYTTERCLHGRKKNYNDIATLNYLQAPAFFGASEDTYTRSASTWGELKAVIEDSALTNGTGLRMVELLMDPEDAPKGGLQAALRIQREADVIVS